MALGALSAPERRLVDERFGADFAEAEAGGIAPAALFAFARCELNGVAPPELIVMGRDKTHCAGEDRQVCGLWVLSRTEEGWIEVLETVGSPRLAASTSRGWTDILTDHGPRPVAYKFNGDAYLADVGDEDLALDPLDEYAPALDGALRVIWFDVQDDMPPEAEAVFAWFWANVALGHGAATLDALPDDFRIGLAPIVPESAPAVAIQGVTANFCDVSGCKHWLYRAAPDGAAPREVARFDAFDLAVAASGAFGHRDLVVTGRGGMQVWRHDGKGYALSLMARPLRPAEAAAD
jgi:hypothetical protein